MPATGELIRLMNYVDDINATLRRISSAVGSMTAEERKRLSEYMRAAASGLAEVVEQLEKGQ
jgi:UV DNA damage repair endonuclease